MELLCTWGARVRRHVTGVGLEGANDIPLFLIYKTLVPKVSSLRARLQRHAWPTDNEARAEGEGEG